MPFRLLAMQFLVAYPQNLDSLFSQHSKKYFSLVTDYALNKFNNQNKHV